MPTPEDGSVTLIMFVDYGTGAGSNTGRNSQLHGRTAASETLTPRLVVCKDLRRCDGEAASSRARTVMESA